jgi:acylphosphatase
LNQKRLIAKISGRVQGVSFRYHTRRTATELKLNGWVRNDPEGTVTAVAEGPEESLKEFLEFLEEGPSFAKVENVETQWSDSKQEFSDFRVAR